METAFFWIIWGLVSFWALKTFYYSFSRKRFDGLRKTALVLNLSVLILTLLPWLPPSLGGKTGLILAAEGNVFELLFILLLVGAVVLFLRKEASLLKIASGVTIANTFVLFATMIVLRPGTFVLSFYDCAPIVAASLLLFCDVVVLLLWQQLELKQRKGRRR